MSAWARAAFVGVLALPAVACGGMSYLVEDFSERHICPQDQMTVRSRPDIRVSTWICENEGRYVDASGAAATPSARETLLAALRTGCRGEPPGGVAEDPERRAAWEREREERRKQLDEGYDTPVEVSGCGFRTVAACAHGRRAHGCYTRLVMVSD